MKLSEVFPLWAQEKKFQVKESSYFNYLMDWENHLYPYFGDMDVESIDKKTVKKWAYNKINQVSQKTVKDIMIVLKMIINYAGEELDVPVSSTRWAIRWPSENIVEGCDKVVRYSQKEMKDILDYCLENPSLLTLSLIIAFTTGIRIGELCALTYGDIDFDRSLLHIRRTVERIYHVDKPSIREGHKHMSKLQIGLPKTKTSNRVVPINPKLKKLLKTYSAISKPEYYICTGGPMPKEPRTLRTQYINLLKKIGFKKPLRFHAIRHTFATTMIERGVDPKTLSGILGHTDISTTLNLYTHPSEESRAAACSRGLKGFI